MYAAGNASRSCAAVRGAHYWTDFEKGSDWDEDADGKVLLGEAGSPIAYLNMVGDPERTRVAEVGLTAPSALPSITSYLARRATDAGHDRITACCPPDDPLAMYLRHYGCEHRQWTSSSGGGMMRLIRLTPLFHKLTDYLTGRVAMLGREGAIALRTDIGAVTLRVRDGAVSVVDGSVPEAELIAEMPQDRLLQLLVGYRDARTIALDDDVSMSDDAARALDAMFPLDAPYMWWSDRF
jgi:predicted acetyltransferase